jgi:CTP synthase
MLMSGINPQTSLVEIIELPQHPYFLASQFHPEYCSTVESPHPLFTAFVAAAYKVKSSKKKV